MVLNLLGMHFNLLKRKLLALSLLMKLMQLEQNALIGNAKIEKSGQYCLFIVLNLFMTCLGSEVSGDREVQRTMLELLNQLDGFSSDDRIRVSNHEQFYNEHTSAPQT